MFSFPLDIVKSKSLNQVLSILESESTKILAGGTDLLPQIRDGKINPKLLVDVSFLGNELSYIRLERDVLQIGALTTHAEICQSRLVKDLVPVLFQACRTIGSQQIRNRASIGGNLSNASPAADTLPALLTLEAIVKLVSTKGTREVFLDEFLLGPGETHSHRDEIITEICIPSSAHNWKGIYKKFGIRNALNISTASIAVIVNGENKFKIAFGALNPRPVRGRDLERALNDCNIREWEKLREIIRSTVKPISDVRASAEYRTEMALNLTYICLVELGIL